MSSTIATIRNLIDGHFPDWNGETVATVNPSVPSQTLGLVPIGGPADVDAAVESAAKAQIAWARLTGIVRAEHLSRWADEIAKDLEGIARIIAIEVGKPIGEARGEAGRAVAILRYFAGEAVREIGSVIPSQNPSTLQWSQRRPLGVVAVVTPWNFPIAIPLWKAAPALAFGNTVVVKPSELSGASAHWLAESAVNAGLPAGVFNVLHGDGSTGDRLAQHERIRAISFTGSERVGRHLAMQAASTGKKMQAEMGGKNAAIIDESADLAKAAQLVASGAMRFAGQKCTATSRAIVHRSVLDAFLDELESAIDRLPIGDPIDASTAIGPVINQSAYERQSELLNSPPFEIVKLRARPSSDGWFIPPTVFRDVDQMSPLAQDEIFGPILSVLVASDLEEAIQIANQTRFGLSATLLTQDLAKAITYMDRIDAGLVRVNGDTTGVDPHAPFGGVKASSTGVREQGPAAKEFYTEIRTIQISP